MIKFLLPFIILITIQGKAQKSQFLYDQAKIHYEAMEFDEALVDINDAINKKNKYYNAYLLRAQIYYDSNKKKDALTDLDYLIENFETADHAHFQKGIINFDDEQYTDALAHFDKAVSVYNHDPEYYYYQGETAMLLKKTSEACTAWNYGKNLEEGNDCKDEFDKKCDGVELIVLEPAQTNNPFKGLMKK